MLKFALYFIFAAVVTAQVGQRPSTFQRLPPVRAAPLKTDTVEVEPFRMCTYDDVDFTKCIHTLHVAENNSIPLALECVRKDRRENCLRAIREGHMDMMVLGGHDYQVARREGLRPIIFGREDDSSLYIAVAPRDISVVDLQEAPIYLNQSNHRAFHAALYFNLQRGHDICTFTNVRLGPYIKIVDSALYTPSDDEILICPNRFISEFEGYRECNVEAGLQRAVFVKSTISSQQVARIRNIFDTILTRFGANSPPSTVENGKTFNFFETFLNRDNVLFKNNTVAFDLQPTYRNGVDERLFNYLHCNNDQQPHDPRNLL